MGRLLNPTYRNRSKLANGTALGKRRPALTPLKFKSTVGTSSPAPVVQYKTFAINKSYLISTLPTHTWSYTLPDLVLGSYIRMVSGVFMQKGGMLTMLRLFRGFKDLVGHTSAAQLGYKIVEPSFSAQISPVAFDFKKKPLYLTSCLPTTTGLKKLERPHHLPLPMLNYKIAKAPRGLGLLRFGNSPLRAPSLRKRATPKIMLKVAPPFDTSLAFNTRRVSLSYPKQNALAV